MSLEATLERIERDAALDLIAAAPPELGLHAEPFAGGALLLAPSLSATLFNRVFALGLRDPINEEDLDTAIARATDRDVFGIQIAPSAATPQVRAALARRGFAPRRVFAKMHHPGEPPDVATELEIAELTRADVADFGRVVATAFEMPAGFDAWISKLVGRPGWITYGGFDGGEMVAAGALYLNHEDAWLGFGATLPEHRGRRAQQAIMVRRIREAFEAGATTVTTETGILEGHPNPSLQNMKRCGFVLAYEREEFRTAV